MDRFVIVVFICEMPSTVLSSESCARNWLLSVGLSGSWFCSWAVISVRKSFIVSPPSGAEALLPVLAALATWPSWLAVVVEPIGLVVLMAYS